MDKRIKEEMKAHSQRQKSIMQEKAKVTNRKTDLQIAKCLALSSSPETKEIRGQRKLCSSQAGCVFVLATMFDTAKSIADQNREWPSDST